MAAVAIVAASLSCTAEPAQAGAPPDTWVSTGTMNVPRFGHTASLLTSGQVLAAGGCAVRTCPTSSSETYNPATGTWTAAGNLNTPRYQTTQTSLPDGRALVAGGCSVSPCATPLGSSETFDPGTGTWSTVGNLNTPRNEHTAVLLANGQVLVAGGTTNCTSECIVTASAEIFNPATNSWTATGNMTTPRLGQTMTLIGGGMVLVTGGCTSVGCEFGAPQGAEVYNPATGQWTATAPMVLNRTGATAAVLTNGQVLVAGGLMTGSYATAAAELYNPQTGAWSATGNMTTERFQPSSLRMSDGLILVANGNQAYPSIPTAELYIPATGQWVNTGTAATDSFVLTRLSTNTALASGGMTTKQQTTGDSLIYTEGPAALVLYTPVSLNFEQQQIDTASAPQTVTVTNLGTIALSVATPTFSGDAGDYSVSGSCVSASVAPGASCSLNVVFTPTADNIRSASMTIPDNAPTAPQAVAVSGFGYTKAPMHWIPGGTMSVPRDYLTLSLLPGDQVLAAGGISEYAPWSSADLFNPATSSWSPAAAMNATHYGHTATRLPNGTVLIAGGGNNIAEVYNPATNAWKLTGPMTVARQYHTATLLQNGEVLVTGGCFDTGACSSTELYNPSTNSWSVGPSMITGRVFHTATLLQDGEVLIAGGLNAGNDPVNSAELYDPVVNAFSATGAMFANHAGQTASLLANGQVLIAGGLLGTSVTGSAELYDPTKGLWSTTGAMHMSRMYHAASVLSSGSVLVAGGQSYCDDDGCSATNSAEIYSPTTGVWTRTNSMEYIRENQAAAVLRSGLVLVAGGDGDDLDAGVLSSAEQFIP